jgi:hypothetical protein
MPEPTAPTFPRAPLAAVLAAIAFAASACGAGDDSLRDGNLGRGTFRYRCVRAEDPACVESSSRTNDGLSSDVASRDRPAVFPKAIALGGIFDVTFQPDARDVGFPTLKPVAPDYLTRLTDAFIARKAGVASIAAYRSSDDTFLDFMTIRIAPVNRIAMFDPATRTAYPDPLRMRAGESRVVALNATGSAGETLAGALDFTWSSSVPTTVAFSGPSPAVRMTLTAGEPGVSQIEVTIAGVDGVRAQLTVEVAAAEAR